MWHVTHDDYIFVFILLQEFVPDQSINILQHKSSVIDSIKCWDLLSEVHRRGVNLLYSNMESLLPLQTRLLPQSTLKSQPTPNPQSHTEQVPQTVRMEDLKEPSDDGSPLKCPLEWGGGKKMGIGNKDVFQSDSESEDDFLSLPKTSRDPAQSTNVDPANVSEAAPVNQGVLCYPKLRGRRASQWCSAKQFSRVYGPHVLPGLLTALPAAANGGFLQTTSLWLDWCRGQEWDDRWHSVRVCQPSKWC